jgi:hypothetical protein
MNSESAQLRKWNLGLLLRYSCGQMRFVAALACFVCLAPGFAQTTATLDAIRYPPLAAAARVKGDILISGGNVVSGPPLLAQTALRSIDILNVRAPGATVLVHFALSDMVLSTGTETIPRGDAFDRFFLRLFRIPTTRRMATQVCTQGPNPPANRVDSTKNPIEVWIYGKAPCIETNTSYTGTLERS